MNHLEEKMKKFIQSIAPIAMIFTYPILAGMCYLVTHPELLGEGSMVVAFNHQESDTHYLFFIGVFFISYVLWLLYSKILKPIVISTKKKKGDTDMDIKINIFILDLAFLSNIAVFGFVYTFVFGWNTENLLFWIVPFFIHLKFLQDFKK